ncbi:MAG: DUF1858 domain-containing protein [Candidatus Micrarchaeia archaeon]|jgi:iron-sulfur cluster assembly accessory protein
MANPVHARKKPAAKQYVTKDTAIGEVASKYPIAIGILFSHGMHCVGCHASAFETIRQGAEAHGMKPSQIAGILDEINAAIAAEEKDLETNCPNSPVKITKAAALQFLKIMEAEEKTGFGLRIIKPSGGPAGVYEMDFEKTPGKDDLEFNCRDICIIVSKAIEADVKGAVIDFRETVQGSGFTIRNPKRN